MAITPDLIGRLRTLIEIQQDQGGTRNEFGEHVEAWQTLFEARAEVVPLSGREFWNAVQIQANVTHRITLRYRGDVPLRAEMRAKCGTRVFYFQVPPRNLDERREWWEILAVEKEEPI